MLIGEFESKLGEKNRVAIPKKFREELDDDLVLTRGYENCLIIVDKKRWKLLIKSIEVKPLLSLNVRDVKRFLVGGAYEINFDSQGRFVIPQTLKDFSSISDDVTFVGIDDWIEIWDKKKWIEKVDYLSKNVSDISERLINLNE